MGTKPTVKIVKGSNKFLTVVREDFSLFVCPESMAKPIGRKPDLEIDRSNSADKGYCLSSLAKRKIRSAANSLYCRATKAEQLNLRFVTFTFPPLPEKYNSLTVQEQDNLLHGIFKKFIDNERKSKSNHILGSNGSKVKLDKYLWVNERQDGERLQGIADARNVLHYHCLFRYSDAVDYWTCNIRWLNLLLRNGFEIFNKAFLLSNYDKKRKQILGLLKSYDYAGLKSIQNELKIKVFRGVRGWVDESVFLQPVDFDKKPILDVESLGKYLSAYITKETNEIDEVDENKRLLLKIYARRWGSSRGLVIPKAEILDAFTQMYPKNVFNDVGRDLTVSVLDEETGELIELDASTLKALNNSELIKIYRFDKKIYLKKIEIDIQGCIYECYYLPPCFKLWAQVPELKKFFKKAFNYSI